MIVKESSSANKDRGYSRRSLNDRLDFSDKRSSLIRKLMISLVLSKVVDRDQTSAVSDSKLDKTLSFLQGEIIVVGVRIHGFFSPSRDDSNSSSFGRDTQRIFDGFGITRN